MIQHQNIDKSEVDRILDLVCQSGCSNVGDIIRRIETGERPSSVQTLNKFELQRLLTELKDIMRAYD